MDELVSVIVLTWNRVGLLRETVESILAQTYDRLELLVIDNESTDKTEEYVTGLADPRVKYFRHQNDGILAVNRNFGIRQAVGRYIAFCDDDDLWLPDKLAGQREFLVEHPEYKVVSTNATYFDEHGDIGLLVRRDADADLTLADFLEARNMVIVASVLIDKEVFADVGYYNEDRDIINAEDLEFMVRVAAAGHRTRFLATAPVRYRVHSGMASHSDTLTTIGIERRVFQGLLEQEVLSESDYATVRKNLSKKYAKAYLKERLKRSGIAKKAVYGLRRARLAARQDSAGTGK